jgi:plasmid stabilization system protein ParE
MASTQTRFWSMRRPLVTTHERRRPKWRSVSLRALSRGIAAVLDAPERWCIVEEPGVRRYIVRRFPFVLYYRWMEERITVYAVMHSSRAPGYWRERIV